MGRRPFSDKHEPVQRANTRLTRRFLQANETLEQVRRRGRVAPTFEKSANFSEQRVIKNFCWF